MKSFIITGIFAASLALAARAAMAATPADPYPHGGQVSRAPTAVHSATQLPQVPGKLNVDVARFIQGMLGGGPVPYANLVRDVRSMPASTDSGYSPAFDYSAAGPDNSASAAAQAQAASDEEVQTINEINDTDALTASMAAAEEENDEANAATLQTEINAGM